ncbi:MAG: hypothetical protein ABI661_03910 [Gammaproteobacteria bacterium]
MSSNGDAPPPLLRTARGKRPQYFADPDVDRLLAMLVSLIGEVAVLRDRLDTVERLGGSQQPFAPQDVDGFAPAPDDQATRDRWRADYLERVFRVLQYEREEATKGRAVDLDRVIEDFTAGRL